MYKCCISVKEIGGKCDAHTLVVEVLAVSAGSHRETTGEGGATYVFVASRLMYL